MLSRCASRQWTILRSTANCCAATRTTRLLRPRWKHATGGSGGLLPPMLKPDEYVKDFALLPEHVSLETKPCNGIKSSSSSSSPSTPTSFSSGGHTPKSKLNNWYQSKHKEEFPVYEQSIHIEYLGGESTKTWSTATVTCQITGVTMEAGTLRDPGKARIKVIDGKTYYDRIGHTESHAAAARLLDSIRYTETGQREPRLCEEEPILLPDTFVAAMKPSGIKFSSSTPKSELTPGERASRMPKNLLHIWYEKRKIKELPVYERSIRKEELGRESTKTWYSANVTCPVTSVTMEAGTLRDPGKSSIKIFDGKKYYERVPRARGGMALHAAAARLLDSIRYTETGQMKPRLCEEEPILLPDTLFAAATGRQRNSRTIEVTEEALPSAGLNGKDAANLSHGRKATPSSSDEELETIQRRADENERLSSLATHKGRGRPSPLPYLTMMLKNAGVPSSLRELFKHERFGWEARTAFFKCPVTGYECRSGTLVGSRDARNIKGTIVYRSKEGARLSAAASFLDDLWFTKTGKAEPRWCRETPSLIQADGVEKLSFDACTNKGYAEYVAEFHEFHALMKEGRMICPKTVLNNLYNEAGLKESPWKLGMTTHKTEHGLVATFSCPFTGHSVKSGVSIDRNDYQVVNGVAYYESETAAEQMAASRMLDDIDFSKTGEAEPRLCSDEPVQFSIEGLSKRRKKPVLSSFSSTRPIRDLDVIYRRLGEKVNVRKEMVVIKRNGRFTATFTCPITGHVVESGRRGREFLVEDGKITYSTDSDAENAAAARFLDDLSFTQTGDSERRQCGELPVVIDGFEEKWIQERSKSPLGYLKDVYKRLGHHVIIDFDTKKDGEWYTATFVCPVTGYEVGSGTFADKEVRVVDGEVFYKRGIDAKQAAASRFLDQLRKTAGETEPLICTEPSVAVKDLEQLISDHQDKNQYAAVTERRVQEDLDAKTAVKDEEDLVLVHPVSSTAPFLEVADREQAVSDHGFQLSVSALSKEEGGNEVGDELVIQNVLPFASSGSTTLDRIMELWGDTVTTRKALSDSERDSSIGTTVSMTNAHQKEKVISDTIDWHDRLARQSNSSSDLGFRVFQMSPPVTTTSATAALRALAKAHWNLPSEGLESDKKIDAVAKRMIDLMRTSGTPSVEAYNCYLRCLSRGSPMKTCKAAEDVLRSMIKRNKVNGHVLPEPNIDTFNTVMQLWAVTGGDAAFAKCEQVFDLIEEARNELLDVHPNRETFLSILSSLSRPSSTDKASPFEREQAHRWINRMNQIGEEDNDDTLVTDTQVFNAPLRWAGGSDASRTRPFTQGLPWDDYSDIFENGFHPMQEDHPLWVEARRIEEWLLEMETIGPEPDLETFEAAIQGWTRTGTLDGLRRAELVAFRALASDKIVPRLQTFHPIIASWAASGDERGLEKIEEWEDRLAPLVPLDERIDLAKMIAKRTRQKQLLLSNDGEDYIDEATRLAESCAQDLQRVIERTKGDDSRFDPTMFAHAISAWGDVALATDVTDEKSTLVSVDSMIGIVKQFDNLVQHYRLEQTKESIDEGGETTRSLSGLKLLELLHYSQPVYLNALSLLNKLDARRKDHDSQPSFFSRHVFATESMLRRAQELRLLLYSNLSKDDDNTSPENLDIQYNDLFMYPSSVSDMSVRMSFLEKQIALYSKIIDGCKQLKDDEYAFGDAVRLAMLVVDLLDQSCSKISSTSNTVDCTDLYLGILNVVEAVPEEGNGQVLLRRLFHCVNALSEKDGSPYVVDKNVILSAMKTDATSESKKKASGRAPRRRVKRQKWRTASQR